MSRLKSSADTAPLQTAACQLFWPVISPFRGRTAGVCRRPVHGWFPGAGCRWRWAGNKGGRLRLAVLLAVFMAAINSHAQGPSPSAGSNARGDQPDPPPLQFAAAEIERATHGHAPAIDVHFEIESNGWPQSYRILHAGTKLRVIGGDAIGGMYGGLDVAEAIRLGTVADLGPGEHRPYVAQRGIKFNLPLDLRTPSYSDSSDAAQANLPEMWDRQFWGEFLDEMARQRFNVLSLWNLNPFPSIVKVPEFPDVALDDVLRGRRSDFNERGSLNDKQMFRPEMLQNAEVVRRMTMDEKIAFWRDVMQMAADRGIGVYWFTWNAFLFTEEGKDGLKRSEPDGQMLRYFRASVRETVRTYPLLAGIGITAGENMSSRMGGLSREQWLWQAYGEGIRDALKDQPNRPFRLIHRLHQTEASEIQREWTNYPGPFDLSFKYAGAHMYGMTNPPLIKPLLPDLGPQLRTWLTVRNDDIYSFRWGDPQYARSFIRAMPGPDKLAGFYMGPDGYNWGREAMDREPESPHQLVMQKQWFSFMLWGRLSYDPALPDALFEQTLAARFPEVSSQPLLAAWTAASQVVPEITRFIWEPNDFQWLPEACSSHPSYKGFYTVADFMRGQGMPESGDLNIRQWRDHWLKHEPMDGWTPLQVAAQLRAEAQTALRGLDTLRPRAGGNKELRLTLGDIEAQARLGQYYAAKIEGAAELALFDATAANAHQTAAVQHLEAALSSWRDYATAYTNQYKQPLLYNRVGIVDIPKFADKAAADIELARQWKPGTLAPAAGNP